MVAEKIHRFLLYPAILTVRGELSTFQLLRDLKKRQWDSHEEIRARQKRALADTLASARDFSPFYKRTIGHLPPNISSTDVEEVIKSLPFVTKVDLQDSAEDLISSTNVGRVYKKTTGGSTGQPVTVAKDSRAIAAERASSWLGYGWFGIKIGDRGARFWGSPIEPGSRRRRFDLADRAMNRIRLSAFGITEDRLDDYWRQCLEFRPRYFYGYVSVLEAFARHVQSRGLDGGSLGLKCIVTTSEVLNDKQRELIEQVFGCRVQNEYGCGEVGPIAYECEAGQLHEMAESLYVEIVRPDGTEAGVGEVGEVVVTDLRNRAMPLVRYRLADRAVRGSDCPCGRGFPVIASLEGRQYDFVHTPDGRTFHGEFFMYAMEDLRDDGLDIQRFRVVQETPDTLRVEVQTQDDRVPDAVLRKLASALNGLTIHVNALITIPLSESGKLRIIENRVNQADERSRAST